MSDLRSKQSRFARLLSHLVLWIEAQGKGWEVTIAECGPQLMRKVQTSDGRTLRALDRVHMDGSLHYARLAADLNLFVGGEFITSGEHEAWQAIGAKWESMDPEARWGGRFNDANHLSLAHEGKA